VKRVIIRGGLGNQLFGLAFADSVAHLTGQPVKLDLAPFDKDPHDRVFETTDLARDYGFDLSPGRANFPFGLDRVLRRSRLKGRVVETSPPADAAGFDRFARSAEAFDGYWQNEAWFARPDFIRERTRAFLDGRSVPGPVHDVVIHYRSFREERVPGRRGGPSALYVSRALDQIATHLGRTGDIVLVSDDLPLALERLGAVGDQVTGRIASATTDMSVMLRARALVLSNSSFSWWAGYCGDAGFVTYPKRLDHFHYPEPAWRFRIV
jgi:hypothetical protein